MNPCIFADTNKIRIDRKLYRMEICGNFRQNGFTLSFLRSICFPFENGRFNLNGKYNRYKAVRIRCRVKCESLCTWCLRSIWKSILFSKCFFHYLRAIPSNWITIVMEWREWRRREHCTISSNVKRNELYHYQCYCFDGNFGWMIIASVRLAYDAIEWDPKGFHQTVIT